jgi:hypothetical protein
MVCDYQYCYYTTVQCISYSTADKSHRKFCASLFELLLSLDTPQDITSSIMYSWKITKLHILHINGSGQTVGRLFVHKARTCWQDGLPGNSYHLSVRCPWPLMSPIQATSCKHTRMVTTMQSHVSTWACHLKCNDDTQLKGFLWCVMSTWHTNTKFHRKQNLINLANDSVTSLLNTAYSDMQDAKQMSCPNGHKCHISCGSISDNKFQ